MNYGSCPDGDGPASVPPDGEAWLKRVRADCEALLPSSNMGDYLFETSERIDYTLRVIERLGLAGTHVCEIGPGGIGLACHQRLKATVAAFDCGDWFRPLYERHGIPWGRVDLHESAHLPGGPYDCILLCEVIEHVGRWPGQVLEELRHSLRPGGVIIVTTQNLHRLSNRLRMIGGRRLFAHFVPEEMVMGHVREYTPEEITHLLEWAGYVQVRWELATFPDLKRCHAVQWAYRVLCRAHPRLCNVFFCWARNGE